MPVLCAPIITSPFFILSPRTISFFETSPTTIPAKSNENPFPSNKSGIIAVSPPTIGTVAFLAPFTSPVTIFLNMVSLFLFAAM